MSDFLEKYHDEIFIQYSDDILLRDIESYKNGKTQYAQV